MITNIIYITVASILIFVLYLAVKAITRGVEAKGEINKENIDKEIEQNNNITDQFVELKKLHDSGIITDEEFKKAKEKILK